MKLLSRCCIIAALSGVSALSAQTLYSPGPVQSSSTSNVGIGVSNPGYELDVRHASDAQIAAMETGSGNNNRIVVGANANEAYVQELYSSSARPLTFKINTELMRIATDGSVGIGTAAPGAKLDVVGGAIRSNGGIVSRLSSAGGLFVGYGGGLDGSSLQLFALYADTTNGLYFDAPKDPSGNKLDVQFNWRGGGVPGLILKGGSSNVGIGTAAPSSRLEVKGPSTSQGTIRVNSAAGQYSSYGWLIGDALQWAAYVHPGTTPAGGLIFANAANVDMVTFSQNGNVGFGTTYPGYKLDVHDTSDAQIAAVEGGSGNNNRIIIGANANEAYVRELYSNNAKPLTFKINTEVMRIDVSGKVGIGTTNPTQKLSVNGTIRAKEVIVDTGWSDYVFKPQYHLASLSEVEGAIQKDGHLPGIPSASEVAEHGISVGEMQAKLLAKIEELTLHVIAQEKRAESQSLKISTLEAELNRLSRQSVP